MSLTAENGTFTFEISSGNDVQSVKAENTYETGSWATVSVILTDDTAKLVVNNGSGAKTTSGTITIDPVEIMSDSAAYLIGDGMNGSMDFFRVNFKEVAEPDYYYTEKEEVIENPDIVPGDLNCDKHVNVFDMCIYKQFIAGSISLTGEALANADINGDGLYNIADMVMLQDFLSGKTEYFDANT